MNGELSAIERDAYRASYRDGIIDLFVGLSLGFIGAMWIWATDYGGLAGVLPAVVAPGLIPLRKKVVEDRGGYVKWSAPRRRWEQRNLWAIFGAGVVVLLLGIGAFLAFESGGSSQDGLVAVGPGLLAFLLALAASGLGIMMEQLRFFAYSAVLVAGGIVAIVRETNPGLPLLIAGAVVTITGTAMLSRYLRANPVADPR
jgi:hypothetical protein